jgi:hypothetical protein
LSYGPINDLRVANWSLYACAIDNMVLNHEPSPGTFWRLSFGGNVVGSVSNCVYAKKEAA